MEIMLAAQAVRKFGQSLIGREIFTNAYGDYPGGRSTVTEVAPDPGAPEIAFFVQHPTWRGDDSCEDGVIGVFASEVVEVPLKTGGQ